MKYVYLQGRKKNIGASIHEQVIT